MRFPRHEFFSLLYLKFLEVKFFGWDCKRKMTNLITTYNKVLYGFIIYMPNIKDWFTLKSQYILILKV